MAFLTREAFFFFFFFERLFFPKPFCDLSLATMIIIDRSQ